MEKRIEEKNNSIEIQQEVKRIEPMEKRGRLEELKRIAVEEGLAKSVSIARKIKDPYLLDELHDSLIDELKEGLKEEGILEEL